MDLDVEHRPSPSPFIARVWRSRSEREVTEMTAVAYARWDLVFWKGEGSMQVSVVGPEPRARRVPVPPGAQVSFGINFEVGTVLPAVSASREVDGQLHLTDVSGRRFHLAGSSWAVPTYDNAEAFVERLIRAEILVRDRLVAEVHRGASTDSSPRTVQRRFLASTGLTRTAARQIDRARNAAILIQEGAASHAVIDELGYYDQAHLGRSLQHYIGRTPTQLRLGGPTPLSLLYKT